MLLEANGKELCPVSWRKLTLRAGAGEFDGQA